MITDFTNIYSSLYVCTFDITLYDIARAYNFYRINVLEVQLMDYIFLLLLICKTKNIDITYYLIQKIVFCK